MTTPLPQYLTGDIPAIQSFLDQFDTFLFDCDGVLWSGDHVFEGTVETLELLRSKGKRIVFVTNNSTKSRVEYKKKLDSLGIPAEVSEIFGSAYSSAIYISRILSLPGPKNKVFILGESGIETELRLAGIPYCGGTDPSLRRDMLPSDFSSIASGSSLDPEVGIVLSGLDYHLNYLKLSLGYHYIQQKGAVFLATNLDSTLPSSGGFFPGAGTTGMALAGMTGRRPRVLGKPSQHMMDAIDGVYEDMDRRRTCMVGDRLETDIRFGVEGGLGGTLAVLTGVVRREELEGVGKDGEDGEGKEGKEGIIRPRWFVDKLGDLREGLKKI